MAAALFAAGLYGALSQQVVVMVMMGLELMITGIVLAASAMWWYLAPLPQGQVLMLVVLAAAVAISVGLPAVSVPFIAGQIDSAAVTLWAQLWLRCRRACASRCSRSGRSVPRPPSCAASDPQRAIGPRQFIRTKRNT